VSQACTAQWCKLLRFIYCLILDPRHDLRLLRLLDRVQPEEEAGHHRRQRRAHHREGKDQV
jgi:hypothetical protein